MHYVDVEKRFLQRYYPHKHLRVAAGLAVITAVLLLLPEPDGPAVTDQVRLTIPVATASKLDVPTVSASYADINDCGIEGFAAVSHTTAETAVPSDTVTWQNVVVRNGDNLSPIFKQLGLNDQDMFRVLKSGEEAAVLDQLRAISSIS